MKEKALLYTLIIATALICSGAGFLFAFVQANYSNAPTIGELYGAYYEVIESE